MLSTKNNLIQKLINVPFVWNTAQNILGANPWKVKIYPSVFKKKGTVLDLGCNIGNTTGAFLDFDYYGVDLDPDVIETAQERWRAYPNVQFHCLDILKVEFKQDFFDHVLFACTGHHLTDDEISRIISVLLSNLKTGGELNFFDVVRQPGKDRFFTRLFENHDQGKFMRTREEYEKLFDPKKVQVAEIKLFPSPDRIIKLQDMLYIRVVR